MNGAELGKAIAEGYKAKAEEWETLSEITLSVIQLDKVPAVIEAVNAFAKQTTAEVYNPAQIMNMAKSWARAKDYGDQGDGVASDMGDLYDLAELPYVDTVYSVLGQPVAGSANQVVILGRDCDVDVDDTGLLQSEFVDGWV